jgi:hypothetical protein
VPAAVALLVAVRLSGATDLCDGVVGLLGAQREEATSWQLAYLRAAVSSRPRRLPAALLEPLAQLCALRLEARLARPSRASGDWSLDLPGRCRCELCASLAAFLRDPARSTLEWPLAKDRRRHVHERIDQAELPVRHETRHSGSPHKLLLTKDPSLFATEAAARRRDESDAAWLSKHFGPTGPPEPTNRRTSTAPRSSKEAPWRQSTTVRAASAPVRNGRGAAGKASTRSTSTRISRAQPV